MDKKINERESLINYSYSFPFIYDDEFENNQKIRLDYGFKWCQLYVCNKYSTFKQELLQNGIYSLRDINVWNGLIQY